MVKIGDWSYSIYLWHWPFIVFAVYLWPLVPYAPIVAALAAMAPALASYRWVEQPIRALPVDGKRRVAALISASLIPPILLAGVVGFSASRYWLPRFQTGDIPVAHDGDTDWTDFFIYLEDAYYPCANTAIRDNALEWEGIARCRQSKPSSDVDVALVGDSHAEHLFLGLAEAFPETNIAFYILSTLPIEDGAAMSQIIDEVASDPATGTVVVNAAWANRGVPTAELTDTLRTLTSAGKRVFVTDDVPVYPFDAKECKYRKSPWIPTSNCSQDYSRFKEAYSQYFPALQASVQAVPGVELLIATRYFCNDESCDMTKDGQLMYRDSNHLNNIGSRYLASRLMEDNPSLKEALNRR